MEIVGFGLSAGVREEKKAKPGDGEGVEGCCASLPSPGIMSDRSEGRGGSVIISCESIHVGGLFSRSDSVTHHEPIRGVP